MSIQVYCFQVVLMAFRVVIITFLYIEEEVVNCQLKSHIWFADIHFILHTSCFKHFNQSIKAGQSTLKPRGLAEAKHLSFLLPGPAFQPGRTSW